VKGLFDFRSDLYKKRSIALAKFSKKEKKSGVNRTHIR